MSLTFSKGHKQLAAVRGCRLSKLEGKIISVIEPDYSGGAAEESGPARTNYKLPDGSFCPVFSDRKFRDTFYIFGMAGCGKSVLTGNIIGEYKLQYPNNPVFIVSRKSSDEAFDGLDVRYVPVDKFVKIDPTSKKGKLVATPMITQDFEDLTKEYHKDRVAKFEMLLDEIDAITKSKVKKVEALHQLDLLLRAWYGIPADKDIEDELEIPDKPEEPVGCLIVYDDVDSMDAVSAELDDAVQKSIKDVLNLGRSFHLSVIVTSHLGSDYRRTRGVLNETGNIVIFPRSSNPDAIRYVLKKYTTLDKDTIERVFKLPSRWVCVRRIEPGAIIYEGGIFLTHKTERDDEEEKKSKKVIKIEKKEKNDSP